MKTIKRLFSVAVVAYLLGALVGLAVSGLVLAGCSGAVLVDTDTDDSDTSETSDAPDASPPDATPRAACVDPVTGGLVTSLSPNCLDNAGAEVEDGTACNARAGQHGSCNAGRCCAP